MPNPSPSRVASRYLDARVVPFRRDREYAAYHAFLKKMRKLQRKVDTMIPLLDGEAEDLLGDAGLINMTGPYFQWGSDKFFRRFEGDLGGKKDIPVGVWPEGYAQERWDTRSRLKFTLEAQVREFRLMREKAGELLDALGSQDFKDNLPYYDVPKRDLHALREGAVAAVQIPNEIDYLLKRMERVNDSSFDGEIPASAELQDLETLYHASVDAKGLYQKGFSTTMPEASSSAGLGGSQTGKGGKKGISFTEDQYVAKEIARVFKEVAMLARGETQVRHILDQIKRHPKKRQIMEWYQKNYMQNGRSYTINKDNPVQFMMSVINPEHVAAVKSGEVKYDPRLSTVLERVPDADVFPGPRGAMGLYLSYLNYSGRYDPKFFGVGGPKGLVKRFQNINPKNIGYIKATVDMTNPHISYGKGEREFRVPPEAVLSVNQFIG